MRREHVGWIILAVVWLAVAIVTQALIDAMRLHSWQRYVAYVPTKSLCYGTRRIA